MIESQTGPASRSASPTISAWRIRFVSRAQPDQRVIRQFLDPVDGVAVSETVLPDRIASLLADSASADELYIVHVSMPKSAAAQSIHRTLMSAPDATGIDEISPRAARVEINAGQLFWKPGRVLIESRHPPDEVFLAALSQFAHDEGHLRQVEKELRQLELGAPADVQRAYLPNRKDRSNWPRMIQLARQSSLLRLRTARLEPNAYSPPRDLPPICRRTINRLAARAAIEDRLEAVSARLEACEDLYEGAVDRIVEQKGQRLEIAIVVILIIEAAFILTELGVSLLRGHFP
jgi:hypothetical protein